MDQKIVRFVEIARKYGTLGVQAAQAFNQQQLALDQVLTRSRLQTSEGTATSLAYLERLRRLTETHKATFAPPKRRELPRS